MDIDRIISIIRTLKEEAAVAMPTNNVSREDYHSVEE